MKLTKSKLAQIIKEEVATKRSRLRLSTECVWGL